MSFGFVVRARGDIRYTMPRLCPKLVENSGHQVKRTCLGLNKTRHTLDRVGCFSYDAKVEHLEKMKTFTP